MQQLDLNEVTSLLENMPDEELAAMLLLEFTQKSRIYHQVINNLDNELSHELWKAKCDQALKELHSIIAEIKAHSEA